MAQHLISFTAAKDLIDRYKANKRPMLNIGYEHSLVYSETFEAVEVEGLLAQPGCVRFRIYLGMKADLQVCMILMGVDVNNNELLGTTSDHSDALILEYGFPCPPECPPNAFF